MNKSRPTPVTGEKLADITVLRSDPGDGPDADPEGWRRYMREGISSPSIVSV